MRATQTLLKDFGYCRICVCFSMIVVGGVRNEISKEKSMKCKGLKNLSILGIPDHHDQYVRVQFNFNVHYFLPSKNNYISLQLCASYLLGLKLIISGLLVIETNRSLHNYFQYLISSGAGERSSWSNSRLSSSRKKTRHV